MNYLAYRTRLKINNEQATLMRQCAGYARWLWNWALDFKQKAYTSGIKLSKGQLRQFYTNHVKPLYPWQNQLSSKIYQYVFIDLYDAFERFFKGLASYPKFKKKGKSANSFTLDLSGKPIILGSKQHKLPFFGWLRTLEKLPVCSTKKVTFSEQAGEWYVSFHLEVDFLPTDKLFERVGVDLGISKLATLSTGKVFDNPKALHKAQKRLARLQRDLSRKVFRSANWNKAKLKVAKAHKKVADLRANAIHHLTTYLAKNHSEIVMEDLNAKGMVKNRCLAKAISDAAFGEIKRQAVYKTERYGSALTLVDRWFPSSQLCSECGHRQKMPLSVRTFSCGSCGMKKDRDFNASLVLENHEAFVAGLVTSRLVDEVPPTVSDEASGKHHSGKS